MDTVFCFLWCFENLVSLLNFCGLNDAVCFTWSGSFLFTRLFVSLGEKISVSRVCLFIGCALINFWDLGVVTYLPLKSKYNASSH